MCRYAQLRPKYRVYRSAGRNLGYTYGELSSCTTSVVDHHMEEIAVCEAQGLLSHVHVANRRLRSNRCTAGGDWRQSNLMNE